MSNYTLRSALERITTDGQDENGICALYSAVELRHIAAAALAAYEDEQKRDAVVAVAVAQPRPVPEEAEANARLIAKAPELLAALRAVCKHGIYETVETGTGTFEELNEHYQRAKALLAEIDNGGNTHA